MSVQTKERRVIDEFVDRAPALSELHRVAESYFGPGWREILGSESNRIVDAALSRPSERGIKESVRRELFDFLMRHDPGRAIEIEMRFYRRRGLRIDPAVRREAGEITGAEFSSPQDAERAYRRASRLIRDSLSGQVRERQAIREIREILERPEEAEPEITVGGRMERELANMAIRVMALNDELVSQSEGLSQIMRTKVNEYFEANGITLSSATSDQQDAARRFARQSAEYSDARSALQETFESRNRILEDMGFTSGRIYFTGLATQPFDEISSLDRETQLLANVRMFNSFMSPIVLAAADFEILPEREGNEIMGNKTQLIRIMREYGQIVSSPQAMAMLLRPGFSDLAEYISGNYDSYNRI
jgi:hypothetical protein